MKEAKQSWWEEEFDEKIAKKNWGACFECCDYEEMITDIKSFISKVESKAYNQGRADGNAEGKSYNQDLNEIIDQKSIDEAFIKIKGKQAGYEEEGIKCHEHCKQTEKETIERVVEAYTNTINFLTSLQQKLLTNTSPTINGEISN